jgi:hypothetical protein
MLLLGAPLGLSSLGDMEEVSDAVLAASESADTAQMQMWIIPRACRPRTVCFDGQRDFDPACRAWPAPNVDARQDKSESEKAA